jgi:hypothetical protein
MRNATMVATLGCTACLVLDPTKGLSVRSIRPLSQDVDHISDRGVLSLRLLVYLDLVHLDRRNITYVGHFTSQTSTSIARKLLLCKWN